MMSDMFLACIQVLVALASVGSAGAAAFTGNAVLMAIAAIAAIVLAYNILHTMHKRRAERRNESRLSAWPFAAKTRFRSTANPPSWRVF